MEMLKKWTDPEKIWDDKYWPGDKIANLLTSLIEWNDNKIKEEFKDKMWYLVSFYKLKYDDKNNSLQIIWEDNKTINEFKLTLEGVNSNIQKLTKLVSDYIGTDADKLG